jgi:hypothetical protein
MEGGDRGLLPSQCLLGGNEENHENCSQDNR